jgi:hypothetical protein
LRVAGELVLEAGELLLRNAHAVLGPVQWIAAVQVERRRRNRGSTACAVGVENRRWSSLVKLASGDGSHRTQEAWSERSCVRESERPVFHVCPRGQRRGWLGGLRFWRVRADS